MADSPLVSIPYSFTLPGYVIKISYTITRYQWRRYESNSRRANRKARRPAKYKGR